MVLVAPLVTLLVCCGTDSASPSSRVRNPLDDENKDESNESNDAMLITSANDFSQAVSKGSGSSGVDIEEVAATNLGRASWLRLPTMSSSSSSGMDKRRRLRTEMGITQIA